MTRSTWSERDVPDLGGTRAIVTGASSGIGLEASRIFAGAGAEVVLAVRDPERGRRAAEEIGRTVPGARLEVAEIDLADLGSVRRFAEREAALARGLDLLVNNAGTSSGPRCVSVDGYEIQMATNFLGHFALTGLLLPLVRPGGRIVTVSSLMARRGHLSAATTPEDLRPREPYRGAAATPTASRPISCSRWSWTDAFARREATCEALPATRAEQPPGSPASAPGRPGCPSGPPSARAWCAGSSSRRRPGPGRPSSRLPRRASWAGSSSRPTASPRGEDVQWSSRSSRAGGTSPRRHACGSLPGRRPGWTSAPCEPGPRRTALRRSALVGRPDRGDALHRADEDEAGRVSKVSTFVLLRRPAIGAGCALSQGARDARGPGAARFPSSQGHRRGSHCQRRRPREGPGRPDRFTEQMN